MANRAVPLAGGLACLAALLLSLLLGDPANREFARGGYVFGFLVWFSMSVGMLGLTMLQHLVHARWGLAIIRVFEAGGGPLTFLLMLLAFLPIAADASSIFPWLTHAHAGGWYLNRESFFIRAAIYFVFLISLAAFLRHSSLAQDPEGSQIQLRANASGPGLVALFFVGSFASFDWLMSLDLGWSSTIFGLLFMIVSALGALGYTIAVFTRRAGSEPYARISDPGLLRDYANLLLTILMLWGYFTFSQYIITWSGNKADEARYYDFRTGPWWDAFSGLLIVGGFFVPFLALQVPILKCRPRPLGWISMWLIGVQVLDLYWMAAPGLHPGVAPTWQDLAGFLGIGGLWIATFSFELGRAPLLPLHDPAVRRVFEHAET